MLNTHTRFEDYKIEIAQLFDVPELNRLVNSAYRGDSSKQGWTTEAFILDGQRTDEQSLKELLQQSQSVILVARNQQNQIKGCVNLQFEETRCYLGMLTVAPDLQGQGIGKLILEYSEKFALQADYNKIYMTVISVRSELIAWYERHGFKKTGETEAFPYGDERFGIPLVDDLRFEVLEKTLFH